jgi:hypothetical protein
MAISDITTTSNVYPSNTVTYNNSKSPARQTNTSTTGGKDTVTLSHEANTFSKETSNTNLPLEAYALPDWYADLHSDLTLLNTELGAPYSETNQARYDSLNSSDKRDLKEYHGYINDYFQEALQDRNISNPVDYYSFLKNDEMNNEVQLEVQQKLANNPRSIELMDLFGINK